MYKSNQKYLRSPIAQIIGTAQQKGKLLAQAFKFFVVRFALALSIYRDTSPVSGIVFRTNYRGSYQAVCH